MKDKQLEGYANGGRTAFETFSESVQKCRKGGYKYYTGISNNIPYIYLAVFWIRIMKNKF